jgi:hypothetical protein
LRPALRPGIDRVGGARHGAIRRAAIVTAAGIAVGAAVATVALPPTPTPENVVVAYVEAVYAEDWHEAWNLLCERTRSTVGSFPDFVGHMGYVEEFGMPPEIDVSIDDLHGASREPDSAALTVAFSVTSQDRKDWEVTGHAYVRNQGDGFRVCDASFSPG